MSPETNFNQLENIGQVKMKPWYKLEAIGKLVGENIFYKPEEVRKLESPDLVTIACLPGEYYWKSGQLNRKILDEYNDYDLFDRLVALALVREAYPQSKIIIYLADDDWKYVYIGDWNRGLVENHRSYLQFALNGLFGNTEVKTVSSLVDSAFGGGYLDLQTQIMRQLEEAGMVYGTEKYLQLPGWLKALHFSVEEKTERKVNATGGGEINEDAIKKVGKVQVGMVVQGLALRKLNKFLHHKTLYLGMYGDSQRFSKTEMKLMMESNIPSLDNYPSIPAVYCPENDSLKGINISTLVEVKPYTDFVENKLNFQSAITESSHPRKDMYAKWSTKKKKSCDDPIFG